MAELKAQLQSKLFSATQLQLISVAKTTKKRWGSHREKKLFLCLTVGTAPDGSKTGFLNKIHLEGSGFKEKKKIPIKDITRLEGGDRGHGHETLIAIVIGGHKRKHWLAETVAERHEFMWCLLQAYKIICSTSHFTAHLPNSHIDMVELSLWAEANSTNKLMESFALHHRDSTNASQVELDVGQSLISEKEESDLLELLEQSGLTLEESPQFSIYLSQRLSALEKANIHAFLESEDMIQRVVLELVEGGNQLEEMLDWLNNYDTQLKVMQNSMEEVEAKNFRLETQARNQQCLADELEELLEQLRLPAHTVKSLEQFTLRGIEELKLERLVAASQALEKVLKLDLQSGMSNMRAVIDRKQDFRQLRGVFVNQLHSQLSLEFTRLAERQSAAKQKQREELHAHSVVFDTLEPLTPLVHSLKAMDANLFMDLRKLYVSSFKKVYSKSAHEFFQDIRGLISKSSALKEEFFSLPDLPPGERLPAPGSSVSDEKLSCGMAFSRSLTSLCGSMVMSEQMFCQLFFLFDSKKDGGRELGTFLETLFGSLSGEILSFVEYLQRHTHLGFVSMLGLTETLIDKYQIKSPFLVGVLTQVQAGLLSPINHYIDSQVAEVSAYHVHAKRCGILAPVSKFPAFVDQLESTVYMQKRAVVDNTYNKLVVAIFRCIDTAAHENAKYTHVVYLENYNHFVNTVGERRVAVLDRFVQNAKQQRDKHFEEYIQWIITCQFGSLMEYISGVDMVLQTMPVEEVQFQLAYSKHAFRRVVKLSLSEANKSVTAMYVRMKKHLCQSEGLLPEAWLALKKKFLEQYGHFETISRACYPQETLPMTLTPLSEYFDAAKA